MEITIKRIDKTTLRLLRREIDKSLKEVGNRYGVHLITGNASYTQENFKMAIKGSLITDGRVMSKERVDFKTYAHIYGLTPEDLDKVFVYNEKKYQVVGLRTSSRKYPIVCLGLSQDKKFRFPKGVVKSGLAQAGE